MPPSDRVERHFRAGRLARAAQLWRTESMAYLLGMNEQQVIREFGRPLVVLAPERQA